MSNCRIVHSLEDVSSKLLDQKLFLPTELFEASSKKLKGKMNQETLNELFHLLKKYDLTTENDKIERNERLKQLFLK